MNTDIIKALAVAAELTNTELSKIALTTMESDLQMFPADKVLEAIGRARREIKGRLTLGEIIDRIDDGRPRADEAWSIAVAAMDEQATVVMNDEIAAAFGVARTIYQSGDEVGARMAFRSAYERIARDHKGMPLRWWPSIGEDKGMREGPLQEAVQLGRLEAKVANQYLPAPMEPHVLRIGMEAIQQLPKGEE
jgi:hypothetical protein